MRAAQSTVASGLQRSRVARGVRQAVQLTLHGRGGEHQCQKDGAHGCHRPRGRVWAGDRCWRAYRRCGADLWWRVAGRQGSCERGSIESRATQKRCERDAKRGGEELTAARRLELIHRRTLRRLSGAYPHCPRRPWQPPRLLRAACADSPHQPASPQRAAAAPRRPYRRRRHRPQTRRRERRESPFVITHAQPPPPPVRPPRRPRPRARSCCVCNDASLSYE